jgi:hypothetical protein
MRAIDIVDLTSGACAARRRDSLTLDIPRDLDWATGGVSVDADLLGHYTAAGGARRVYSAHPVKLRARAHAEECLIADDEIEPGGAYAVRRYRLCAVERTSAARG